MAALALTTTALLSACASKQEPTLGKTTSTDVTVPTTAPLPVGPPSAAERAATTNYLAGAGAPILEFVRSTSGLISDAGDAVTVCRRYGRLRPTANKYDELIRLIGDVPDPVLKKRLYEDVGARFLMLQCATQPIDRLKPANVEQFRTAIRARNAALVVRLKQFGLTLTK